MMTDDYPIRCIVEANHIHRAGQKYNKKIFLVDVIGVLANEVINKPVESVTVLYGTVQGAEKEQVFINAMMKNGYHTNLIPYTTNTDGTFNFATDTTLDATLGEVPPNTKVILIGFSGRKYVPTIVKHSETKPILLAAFSTVNTIGAKQYIFPEVKEKVRAVVYLDNYAQSVFSFHQAKRYRKEGVSF